MSKRALLCCTLVAGLAAGAALARTWTSATGSQVEADLVRVDGTTAVLRTADGRQLQIGIEKLSSADQVFLLGTSLPPAKVQGAATNAAAAKPAGAGAAAAGAIATNQFLYSIPTATIQPVKVGALPPLKLNTTARAMYGAFQFGPATNDIVFVIFDSRDLNKPYDVAYLYTPGRKEYPEPTKRHMGTKAYKKSTKAVSLRLPKLKSSYGDITAETELEIYTNLGKPTDALAVADVETVSKAGTSRFRLGALVTELMAVGDGEIAPIVLLRKPVLFADTSIEGKYDNAVGYVAMGEFKLLPGSGMDKRAQLVLSDEKGAAAMQAQLGGMTDDIFMQKRDIRGFDEPLRQARVNTPYKMTVSINLGPHLGVLTKSKPYERRGE